MAEPQSQLEPAGVRAYAIQLARWVLGRWDAEVADRPLCNIHRRTLDETWRQIYRHLTGGEMPRQSHAAAIEERDRIERAAEREADHE